MYVTFRNCTTKDVVFEKFKKEVPFYNFLNIIFKRGIPEGTQRVFMSGTNDGQSLNVGVCYEPDDIIWDNLSYTVEQQRLRTAIMYLISIIVTFVAIIITVFIGGFKKWMQLEIPTSYCPEGFNIDRDPQNFKFKTEILDDYYNHHFHERVGKMGCYCSEFSHLYFPWELFMRSFDVSNHLEGGSKSRLICLEIHLLWCT